LKVNLFQNFQNHLTPNRNIDGFQFYYKPNGNKIKELCNKVLTDMINLNRKL